MTREIRMSASPGEARVALLRDGTLVDYAIWRPGAPDGVGELHRGRVIKPVRAMGGAFVEIEGAEGFLPDTDGAKGLTEGAMLTVRIVRAAQSGKGPRLSAKVGAGVTSNTSGCVVDPADRAGPVRRLRGGPSPVDRFASAYPDAGVMVDDPALAAGLRGALGQRVSVCRQAFDDTLEAEVDSLAEAVISVPGGARVSIYPTPALCAIDVDAAAALGQRGPRAERHLAINRDVLPALARQIRLRNLSGAIIIDLAGLAIRARAALGPALSAAFSDDPLRPRFLGFSGLGLAEILRPRIHAPLHELLHGPHAAGLRALRAIACNLPTDPRQLPRLRAPPTVIAALQRDPVALADLARRAGRELTLRSDPALPADTWVLEEDHG